MAKDDISTSIQKARKRLTRPEAEVAKYEAGLDALTKIGHKIATTIEKDTTRPIQLSWLPTDTARTSIFSPIADQELKERFTELTFKSAWGSLKVVGPPLNISDEGVFLALSLQRM